MAKASDNALVKHVFPLLQHDPEELREVLRENLGPKGITPFELDKLQVPAGGGLQWEISSLEGDKSVAEVDGVIAWWSDKRSYWKTKFGEGDGNSPPDCSSDDGETGVGDPGGVCAKCPFSQFGSGDGGRGQACKQMRFMLVATEDRLMPLFAIVPPTSIRSIHKYFLRLASGTPLRRYYNVVTKFKLERAVNAGGIKYAQYAPSFVRDLDDEEKERMKMNRTSIIGDVDKVSVKEYAANVPPETEEAETAATAD